MQLSADIVGREALVEPEVSAMIRPMKVLPADAGDDAILEVCREWVDLVAEGRFADAIALLYVPASYQASQRWTPESLQTYIGNYGSWEPLAGGQVVRMTPFTTARVPVGRPSFTPHTDIVRLPRDRTAGSVELDVPLDGEWSDLTAQFEFAPVDGGIGISLYDLHVL